MTAIVDAALAPLDAARTRVYRWGGAWASRWLASRETRVAILLVFGIATSLAGTLLFPYTMLVYAPLVLGVPHLVADLRYLVARPGLHRRVGALAMAIPLVAVLFDPRPWVGLLSVFAATILARTSTGLRAAGLAAWATVTAWAWTDPRAFDLVLMHGHNAVALGLWWAWRANRTPAQLAGVGLAIAVYVGLVAGVFTPVSVGFGLGGVDLGRLARGIAPFDGPIAERLLLAYVFGQAMHYVAWLRLVPEDDRPRYTPRPFRATARALVGDLGAPLILGAITAIVALIAWGLVAPAAARSGYLNGALFHGHLELAAVSLLLLERRRPGAVAA